MERLCIRCGSTVSGDTAFCPNCGAAMDGSAAANTAPSYQQAAPAYQQPAPIVYNNINTTPEGKHMTTGQWVLTILLASLGPVGIVLLFVWGFGNNEFPDKKTYARAMLIWSLVAVIFMALYAAILVPTMIGFVESMASSGL